MAKEIIGGEKKGGGGAGEVLVFQIDDIILPPLGFCSANRYSCQGNLKKKSKACHTKVTGKLTFNGDADFLLCKLPDFIHFWSSLFNSKQQSLKLNISEITWWPFELWAQEASRELTIDVVVDFSSIMQQPELLPAQHPARFPICQFMAERQRTDGEDTQASNAALWRRTPHWSLRAQADVYVMKWGWLPSASSNFSRKVRSQASPGLRHSSFCKQQQQQLWLTGVKVAGKHQL